MSYAYNTIKKLVHMFMFTYVYFLGQTRILFDSIHLPLLETKKKNKGRGRGRTYRKIISREKREQSPFTPVFGDEDDLNPSDCPKRCFTVLPDTKPSESIKVLYFCVNSFPQIPQWNCLTTKHIVQGSKLGKLPRIFCGWEEDNFQGWEGDSTFNYFVFSIQYKRGPT